MRRCGFVRLGAESSLGNDRAAIKRTPHAAHTRCRFVHRHRRATEPHPPHPTVARHCAPRASPQEAHGWAGQNTSQGWEPPRRGQSVAAVFRRNVRSLGGLPCRAARNALRSSVHVDSRIQVMRVWYTVVRASAAGWRTGYTSQRLRIATSSSSSRRTAAGRSRGASSNPTVIRSDPGGWCIVRPERPAALCRCATDRPEA